jgi:membrane glycosyltransferase
MADPGAAVTFAPRQLLPRPLAPVRLTMPDQCLTAPFRDPAAPSLPRHRRVTACRAFVFLVPLGAVVALIGLWIGAFAQDGHLSLPEAALSLLSGFAFFWMAFSVATAILGLFWQARPPVHPLHGIKVAILLPMYGEPATETMGNAVRLLQGVSGQGRHGFSLHVLSDTRSAAAVRQEEATVAAIRRHHPGLALTYRRRDRNTDYKSGNIRDWVTEKGHAHDAMLILDADSVMGPASVIRMADAMAREPGLGLIQTIPRILPGRTIWQGLQSFAAEVYGQNMGRGLAMWTGGEGNFLGHNAMVRTRAFAASAGLPHLPGPAPRGGVILSHDFVEAALLRRAGWGVQMMPDATESQEDTPETLIGYLRRDQRWCQGNLQHLRLLRMPGLHPVSRFHLFQGAMAYLSALLWPLLLLLWAMVGQDALAGTALPQAAIAGSVALTLLAPKLLGILGHVRDNGPVTPRFAGLVLAEIAFSALIAPALMVQQARAVLRTLRGQDGGWRPHETGRAGLFSLLRFHAAETALGAALLSLCAIGAASLWLLPIAVSLFLTVPLVALAQMPQAAFIRRPQPEIAA